MSVLNALLLALVVSKVLLVSLIYFLWRSNSRLKEANHIIFLMRRRGIINERELEELKKAAAGQTKADAG